MKIHSLSTHHYADGGVGEVLLDLAATLFTPETPKVFCGLKHFTHPSIGIVVSR